MNARPSELQPPARRIRVLGPDVTNKIAAGEVIERPASVVKELVENALDAGASAIRIEVKGGGKELIRVSDDGCGIPADEVETAFLRHATSKIESADDLAGVRTLGFRGEALPSIASVSKVTFVSRTRDQLEAVKLEVAGEQRRRSVAGAAPGTQVSVAELFYNTPARFKFLKSDAAERRTIAEYVTHLALARPETAFTLVMEGREVLRTHGSGNLKETIASIYGKKTANELVAVEWLSAFLSVSGYVGKPELAKGTRGDQSLFVNGRWVQNRLLSAAVEKGFESLLAHRKFPFAVLHIEIDPTLVDVNVHPAKAEIRFKDERETFKAVMLAVRSALASANLVKEVAASRAPHADGDERGVWVPGAPDLDRPILSPGPSSDRNAPLVRPSAPGAPGPTFRQPRISWHRDREDGDSEGGAIPLVRVSGKATSLGEGGVQWLGESREEWSRPRHSGLALAEGEAKARLEQSAAELARRGWEARELLESAEVVGHIANTFLLVPVPFGLWIVDQHVAHERILYEQVLRQVRRGGGRTVEAQELLIPQRLTLSPALREALAEHRADLERFGFALEAFGGADYLLRAVPAGWNSSGERQISALLDELISVFTSSGPSTEERAAASIACRGAVKAGEALPQESRTRLVRALAPLENPFACPHGRPVILHLGVEEIERRFGRT